MNSKAMVFYASRTGNTEKLAKAILRGLPSDTLLINPSNNNGISQDTEVIFLGFWVDKGDMNEESLEFLELLRDKKVVLFGTLGGDPESVRALELLDRIKDRVISKGNKVLGSYLTRGEIDPKIVMMMEKQFPKLATDEQHLQRVKAAQNHPNEEELAYATSLANELYVEATK